MILLRVFVTVMLAAACLAAPSQADTINFTNADLGSSFNTTGATAVDLGTVVVTRNPASVADGGLIDSVIYTVNDPSIGGNIEVTVSVTSTTGNNVVDFTPSRSEIPNVAAGGNVTLSGAITSAPAGSGATFLGFSQIDFESLSGGEDTTITSGGVTTGVLDSSASGDRFTLADEFAGIPGAPSAFTSFTLNHVGSVGNTGSWDLRDWDFSVEFTAVPEPSSLVMLGLGGLVSLGRRRKR